MWRWLRPGYNGQARNLITMDNHWSLDNFEDPPNAELACDEILSSLRTTFGKLVALAFLRLKDSGEYRSPRFEGTFAPEVVTRVLGTRHERTFREWLALSMEDQFKDLSEFLAANPHESPPPAALADPSVLIPAAASAPERALFLIELDFTLGLIDGK